MATTKNAQADGSGALKLSSAELLAALSYLTDVTPSGSHYHSWRVALVSQHLAGALSPAAQRGVFYAGLLHDAGAVGAHKHITQYTTLKEQTDDVDIRSHSQRGAALLNWLPGMGAAAQFVASHHEWWNGRGYPGGRAGDAIPLGSLILGITTVADIAGCFRSKSNLRSVLPTLSSLTSQAWPPEVWAALVRSTKDAEFYRALADPAALPGLVKQKITELKVPEELDNEEGVERVLHLFAALVDLNFSSTTGHSLRTARRAEALARLMKLSDEESRTAYRAGLVHDCGRLGIDAYILNKSGRFSETEMQTARKHAEMTIRVLGCLPECPGMEMLGQLAGHDHERVDGNGYPDKLQGDNIPLISRVLSVVDAFDSMVSSQQYRLLTPKGAVVRLEQNSGTQFDPSVVEAMVAAIRSGAFDEHFKAAA